VPHGLNERFRHIESGDSDSSTTLELSGTSARVLNLTTGRRHRADAPVHRFERFVLDVGSRELWAGDRTIRLQSQPFEILALLLARAGHVVEREELHRRLWPDGTFVDYEHGLNAAIKRLRNALGDDAERPRFIETIPRRGYRFVASVLDDDRGVRPRAFPVRAHCPRLAVLPATHAGPDQHFAEGFTEELRAQIGRVSAGAVAVIARSSSILVGATPRRVSEIGEALRVDYVLEGSVRGDGDRFRITVCLVETIGETHVWSETVECRSARPLTTQVEVATRFAQSVTEALRTNVSIDQAR
jgi:DNA-binding winged helix-turn-helix (wHTH) protein